MANKTLQFTIGANARAFFRALARIRNAVRRLAAYLKTALRPLATLGGALSVASGAGAALGIRNLAAYGAELNHLSSATGIAVEKLAILRQAFIDAGASPQELGPAMSRMQQFLTESLDNPNTQRTRTIWENLGLDPRQLQKLSPDKQFSAIIGNLHAIDDAARKAHTAQAIFGRSGIKLFPITTEGLADAEAALGSLPGRMGQINVQLERLDTIIGRAGAKVQQFFSGFSTPFLGKILTVAENLNRLDFAPLGEKVAHALQGAFEGVRGLVRLLFEGNLFKFLKHKLLGLAHLIGEAIGRAFTKALNGMQWGDFTFKAPEPSKNKYDYRSTLEFEKADRIFKNAAPLPEIQNPTNPLQKLAAAFQGLFKPTKTKPFSKAFAIEGIDAPRPQLPAPVVGSLQTLGLGGRVAGVQATLPTIAQNTAKTNTILSATHALILRVADSLTANVDPVFNHPFHPTPLR